VEITAGNGSYEMDTTGYEYDMHGMETSGGFYWLGIDPFQYPICDGTDLTVPDRWKAYIEHTRYVNNDRGMLTGSLPTGPVGANLSVGSGRLGEPFEGDLDEVRVTALPIMQVAETGWALGDNNVAVQHWYWDTSGPMPTLNIDTGGTFDMVDISGLPQVHWGGYFMAPDDTGTMRIYSYLMYVPATGTFAAVAQVNDDLTPTGLDTIPAAHEARRPVIPLNFFTTVALSGAIAGNTTSIQVPDITQFPESGYVKVEDEILAYESKNVIGAGPAGTLELAEPYRRGCYGTTAAAHPALGNGGMVLRHLPVRHIDRFRYEDVTTNYTDALLNGAMSMLSYNVSHAGELSMVRWRFKEPLEDGQRAYIAVLVDDDDDDGDTERWSEVPQGPDAPLLWADLSQGDGTQEGFMLPGRPTVATGVEVRCYFDLSQTHPYNFTYDDASDTDQTTGAPAADGWEKMVELDEVMIEMAPNLLTF
jgi:hypothetical protein